ncbi:polyribonucleotide 5'-hydroxyl-kinase Clp1-like [Paramacrobiotus metropolitanus]|uniref:polyribonucleotide 5'-hydroxyl-kinase Clp1-like n=1 Tax=Paramacrobiotus metropolitanus TaxID=2943436 RepID=UPI0024462988|nr:polyribonucleotide 5'-hydroxyl-kinase Clp1-like [Paramacrobiotus metropolitanus]XP_055329300.1 polyribonucleotide 5'-hydroxyl-kinase Clp1-like [Paramacrobiotus metropolitanus]XP_055329302.1 polyribonucleotide 5'-hydroxyl-kinase Clp1-like [Paramacrobiotus metropolitanus]
MAEAIPRVSSQTDLTTGPYGKLPVLARELKNPDEHKISPLEEMRINVDKVPIIHLWMAQGQAEVFGAELSTDRIYTFLKGSKISIWSWTGCTIMIEGKPKILKTKDSRVTTIHFNFHNCLEQHREVAVKNDVVGPRILVLGNANSGRSVFCRLLLNYAARMRGDDRRNPIFVDLDFIQPDLAVPGTIACCQFDRPTDPMFDYYYYRKFVLPYGYLNTDPETNPNSESNLELLHSQIRKLGAVIEKKFDNDRRARHSGAIINCFSVVKEYSYSHIFVIAKAFRVNFIVVLGNKWMVDELQNHPSRQDLEPDLQVISMPKAQDIVESTQEERRLHREARIRHNIYGHPLRSPKHRPFKHEVEFSDILLCKLGNPAINKALLPENVDLVRVKTAAYPLQLKEVNYLVDHILYITNVDTAEKVASEGSVIGYLLVKGVTASAQSKKLTLLSNFETLPKKVLLTSAIQLKDS